MFLSKRVPAKTIMVQAKWCRTEWLKMSQKVRRVRAKSKNKMDKCYWCKHAFIDEEMMALACFEKIGNNVLCRDCALELQTSE